MALFAALLAAGAVTPPAFDPLLQPLARLVGACWAGEVAPGAFDTHCYSVILDGHHIRDSHRVTVAGKVVYAGEALFSREGDSVVFTYLSTTGGIGHGTVTPRGGGLAIHLSMRGNAAAAAVASDHVWRWRDADAYAMERTGQPPVIMRRTTALPPPG